MFYILELQETNGSGAHIMQTAATKNEAMSKYHTVLSFAAVSSVEYHTCIVIDEHGRYHAMECYEHPTSVEPEEPGGEING